LKIPTLELNTGRSIPAFGLGTWQLRGDDCVRAVSLALEIGYTHIDTSDDYGNEEEIGRALRGFDREKVFITSKVDDSMLRKDDVVRGCEGSLKRLGVDYIDLYLIHRPNPTIPISETMQGMKMIVDRGWVRNIGISNFGERGTAEAVDAAEIPVCNNQIKIHPYHYPAELIGFLQERNITVTAYSPLDTGQLVRDDLLTQIGERHGKSAAQVSIRWLLDRGLVVIPKATTEDHVRENIDFDWELSDEDDSRIEDPSVKAMRG
jgi:2,5-diketo-D-gluconate reductase B